MSPSSSTEKSAARFPKHSCNRRSTAAFAGSEVTNEGGPSVIGFFAKARVSRCDDVLNDLRRATKPKKSTLITTIAPPTHNPVRSCANLCRIFALPSHDSILSTFGVSGKPGAIQEAARDALVQSVPHENFFDDAVLRATALSLRPIRGA